MPSSVIFCNSSMLILPGIFSNFDLTPLFITPSAPITTGIVIVFIFHTLLTSIRSLYFENFRLLLLIHCCPMVLSYQSVGTCC